VRVHVQARGAALTGLFAGLLALVPPGAAATVPGPATVDCPVQGPDDLAVIGTDTIVVGQIQGAGSMNVLVCRITAGGTSTWKRTLIEPLGAFPVHVTVGSGGIYVGFTITDVIGWRHAVVQRLGLDGSVLQRIQTASGGHDVLGEVAAGPDGRVYATGYTSGTLLKPPASDALNKAFVRAFDASLNTLWTSQFQGTSISIYTLIPEVSAAFGTQIAVDSTGVYIAGLVDGTLPGGPAVRSGRDSFVRRYSTSGAILWTKQFDAHYSYGDPPPEAPTTVNDIALTRSGLLVGGDGIIGGNGHAFIRLYDLNGATVWTTSFGGSVNDSVWRLMPDRGGASFMGGADHDLLTASTDPVMFLAHVASDGSMSHLKEFWSWSWSGGGGAQVVGDGEVVRLISAITAAPLWTPPSGATVIPVGTFLYRFDLTPPAIGAPVVKAIARSSVGSSLSLAVSWSASDAASGVAGSEVQVSTNGGAWQSLTVPSASTRSLTSAGPVGGTVRFRARATDGSGNVSSWSYGPTVHLAAVQETSTAIIETSSWGRVAESGALGGYVDRTTIAGGYARYTFTGRAISWIGALATTRGKAHVYIDGTLVATVDCYSSTWSSHRVLYSWAGAYGTHTIQITNLGTSGRPRIDLDAFIVLK
jgi:hypothetical protein